LIMAAGYRLQGLLQLTFLLLVCTGSDARILEASNVPAADIASLQEDVSVFATIQEGVVLSVAECELSEECEPVISKHEIEQIISTIEDRVTSLSARYLDSGDPELEDVLIGYAETRDRYQEILEKMEEMPQFYEEEEDENDAMQLTGGVPPELYDLLYDADEELMDDFIVDELEEDYPADENTENAE